MAGKSEGMLVKEMAERCGWTVPGSYPEKPD
jgi:hypothetical protein